MDVTLQFLGAAGTVTGSKYLVSDGTKHLLVDCGMFQGERSWREKNWAAPPFALDQIDAVLLTHAHIDHVGMLPRYHKLGLNCPVYCNNATKDLTRVILLDSGRLQEEEAEFRLERGKSRHHPPLPLYTEEDAARALELIRPVSSGSRVDLFPGISATWKPMGHIIGASGISLRIGGKSIVFSGDIGRYNAPILRDPSPLELGDLLLIESTYGDRLHGAEDPKETLAAVINRTTKRGGLVLIPSFAVGRAQTLLFYLRELKLAKQIDDIPVIIDSPMAEDATTIYLRNVNDYDEESLGLMKQGRQPFLVPRMRFIKDRSESIKLNSIREPMVLISASGMLTGGRILHHLKHRLPDPRNTLLFVGFQPPGSRGDWIKQGHPTCQIFSDEVQIRSEVAEISGFSAHADRDELLRWCRSCSGTPGKVAVVHGEPNVADKFSATLSEQFGWKASAAQYLQKVVV